ncbi:hypothetical protein HFM87_04870 [Blautia producta]|nr:hypothetical protein [Blautia producta]
MLIAEVKNAINYTCYRIFPVSFLFDFYVSTCFFHIKSGAGSALIGGRPFRRTLPMPSQAYPPSQTLRHRVAKLH